MNGIKYISPKPSEPKSNGQKEGMLYKIHAKYITNAVLEQMNQFNSSLALDNNSHESAIQLQVPKWAATIFWITMATSIQSMPTSNN